jgi:hypothetical protein
MSLTPEGLEIRVLIGLATIQDTSGGSKRLWVAVLNCCKENDFLARPAILLNNLYSGGATGLFYRSPGTVIWLEPSEGADNQLQMTGWCDNGATLQKGKLQSLGFQRSRGYRSGKVLTMRSCTFLRRPQTHHRISLSPRSRDETATSVTPSSGLPYRVMPEQFLFVCVKAPRPGELRPTLGPNTISPALPYPPASPLADAGPSANTQPHRHRLLPT